MLEIRVVDTPEAKQAAYGIRIAVFVEEQAIPLAEEFDGWDEGGAVHYLGFEGDDPVATARLIPAAERAKLGRIAVLERARGRGHGDALLRRLLADARAQGYHEAVLDAQIDKIAFYERFGFAAHGPEFDDGGIAHRRMTLALEDD